MEEGAYLYVKKPFDKEIMKYLWQFVLREKMRREKARQESRQNRDQMNVEYQLRGKRGRKSMKGVNGGESQTSATAKVVRQTDYLEWTDDLHDKFMKAVRLLGEGSKFTSRFN